jgi:GntR family transcriptional regulator, transcriptional repressor for pyruvate dehydrogenase complex
MKAIEFGSTPVVPMNRDRLYEQVAQQIQELIVVSRWPAGQKIPAERDLGERFGVSRPVIREALRALAERGLVSIRPGRGIFVTDLDVDALKEPMKLMFQRRNFSYENLVETRRVLEVEIAGLAAGRAEPDQVDKMRAAIDEMDATIGESEEFIKADHAFHVALAEATQNPLLPMLIDSVGELVRETRRLVIGVGGSQTRGQYYHRRLLDAVERRDAAAARKTMGEHLNQFDADIRAAKRLAGEV